MTKPFAQANFSEDPLESMAYQLGQLLKAYAGNPGSATDLMALLHAFQAGFEARTEACVELKLPLQPREEAVSVFWDGSFPRHRIDAKDVMLVSVGGDFVDLTTKRIEDAHDMYGPNTSLPKGAMLAIDPKGRLALTVRKQADNDRREIIA